ncbi:hypothetical protein [Variovorax sp. W6]|uniref:hypothetical protein n=1 Tax=Variovorax sp. W6 TaxID=3093895 RepID=UPI003D8045F8
MMNPDAVADAGLRESSVEPEFPAGNNGLEILGLVPRPGIFTRQALERLGRHDLGPTQVLCYSGRPVAQVDSYAGARLVDVLDACGLSERPRSELKRCVFVARGDDGYQAIFSWNELYNSATGEKVLVLYEKNGAALDAHLGVLCLISAGDSRLGPRHLRGLLQVAVKML